MRARMFFLAEIGAAETRLARAIERLNAYREAGAQSLFRSGVKDQERTLRNWRMAYAGPVNILEPLNASLAELEKLGVRA